VLAEELSPNHDATEWTIRLKDGITFHNGKDLTAADVVYTLRTNMNPKVLSGGANLLGPVDVAGIKQVDRLTLKVPYHTSFAVFPQVFPGPYFGIIPVGWRSKDKPIGTGPFKYESFTPGQSSTFVRNPNYWQSGLPYLDHLVVNDYHDETSQLNALSAGEVNAISLLSAASIGTAQAAGQVVVSDGGGWTPFTMRVDTGPFKDVRVRQAMRYAIDRQQMLSLLFRGHGTLGNDLFAIWDPAYDHSLPQRPYDPEKARSLLKQAGQSGFSAQLITADIAQGTLAAAQLLAEQVGAAGIRVSLNQVTSTDLYGPNYLKWYFAQDFWAYNPYMIAVEGVTLPTSPANETHFDNPRYNDLFRQALSVVADTSRVPIIHEMQQIDYDEGGLIIPYFPPVIDAYAHNVDGFHTSKAGTTFGNNDLMHIWLT